MSNETRLERIERMVEQMHHTVVLMEQDHGAKLDAIFEKFDVVDQRLDRMERGQRGLAGKIDKLEQGQRKLEQGQRDIKVELASVARSVNRLQAVANNHETRLQRVESGT